MKKDMDKVRGVLLALEGDEQPCVLTHDMPALGGTKDGRETVEYIQMLHSASFLDRSSHSVYRLSWAGYEFFYSVRDPEIWRQTKAGARKIGSWSVKLLGELALGYSKAKALQLGLPV